MPISRSHDNTGAPPIGQLGHRTIHCHDRCRIGRDEGAVKMLESMSAVGRKPFLREVGFAKMRNLRGGIQP